MENDQQDKVWRLDIGNQPRGPYSVAQIAKALQEGRIAPDTPAFGPGMVTWSPLNTLPVFMAAAGVAPPEPPAPPYTPSRLAHEIDFQVFGDDAQYVEIELDPGEAVVGEAGAMMFMEAGIQMETIFGDGAPSGGVLDRLVGAGKRLLTGEGLFMTVFSNEAAGKQKVAFSAPYPGRIVPLNLAELGGEMLCQKDAFLCAAKGVSVGIAFQKRLGVGLFGGEGFIMQRLTGDGLSFVHAGGSLVRRDLAPGERLRLDTGCLVALDPSVDYDIQYVGSIKSAIFGGEGLFFATVAGPGTVWMQSLPFSRLAGRIYQAMPKGGGKDVGEGSVLGGLGKIFER